MSDFVFCIVCHSPRDMSDVGLVEKCEYCGDAEYVRSDFYVPDGKLFYGYIQPSKINPAVPVTGAAGNDKNILPLTTDEIIVE